MTEHLISRAYRKNYEKDVKRIIEIFENLYNKKITKSKAKEIITKAYGFYNLKNSEIVEKVPQYEHLYDKEKLIFSSLQRERVAEILNELNPTGIQIDKEHYKLKYLFNPDTTVNLQLEKYRKKSLFKSLSFNSEKWLKNRNISENPFYFFNDKKGEPIILDFDKIKNNIVLSGSIHRIQDFQKSLIKQHIENNSPFVLIQDNSKENIISKSELDLQKELFNYDFNIEYIDNIYHVNLLNIKNLLSLFMGTKIYQENINNKKFTDSVYCIIYSYLFVSKSRFMYFFYEKILFEDLVNMEEVLTNAYTHIYQLRENIYANVTKKDDFFNEEDKYNCDIRNSDDAFKFLGTKFQDMVSEVLTCKNNLIHVENDNIYDINYSKANFDLQSYVFSEPKNEILKSLLNQIICSSNVAKKDKSLKKICQTDFEIKPYNCDYLLVFENIDVIKYKSFIPKIISLGLISCFSIDSLINTDETNTNLQNKEKNEILNIDDNLTPNQKDIKNILSNSVTFIYFKNDDYNYLDFYNNILSKQEIKNINDNLSFFRLYEKSSGFEVKIID